MVWDAGIAAGVQPVPNRHGKAAEMAAGHRAQDTASLQHLFAAQVLHWHTL